MAEAPVYLSEDSERRFVEHLKVELLAKETGPQSTTVPQEVRVIDVRTPSFLLKGGCLVQVETVYSDKTLVFWCLFFDGETDAVVVPFQDHETSIPDVISSIEGKRKADCVRIDPETIGDYVAEVMNYELARGAVAGLLVQDLDLHSRTFGVLDWPTPLLESEKLEVNACLSTHNMRVHPDTGYSLRVEACMVDGDALVWREFRVFTKDNSSGFYDRGKKGQVLLGKRETLVLVKGLPDNCRAKPGASLGIPKVHISSGPEGWELILLPDALSILSDLARRIKPVLDPIQLGRFRRQHLTFYDLDLLEIEPENSEETGVAYVLWKPGFALPLDMTSSPIHQMNEILAEESRSKSRDGQVIQSAEEAARYVVFFARHVWGDEGPFMVLKSKDDSTIGQLDLTDAKLITDRFDSVGAALAAITEPAPIEVASSGDQRAFEVAAWVLYGDCIFTATFKVLAEGSIEMTDDAPMVSARVKGNPNPRYRPLASIGGQAQLKPLTASELENECGQSTVENRVLTGQLTREILHVRLFRRCRFRGRVNLQLLASDHGLSFEECVFENGLDLSGASLKGELSIMNCLLVRGKHHSLIDTAEPFSFDNLSADSLLINELWSTDSLSASGMRIHGAVRFSGLMTLGGINLPKLAAHSLYVRETQAKKSIELQNCVIDQFIYFSNIRTSHGSGIELYGTVITHNYAGFTGVSLAGDLSATFLRVGTAFFLQSDAAPNTIGGSINLDGAHLPERLQIRNTHVVKSIRAKGVATAEVRILGGRLSWKPEAAAEDLTSNALPATEAKPNFESSRIGGSIDLTDADIQHDVTLVDLVVGTAPDKGKDSNASLVLRNTKVGGNVKLFLTAKDAQAQEWLHAEANAVPDFSGVWQRGLDLENAAILGDVDLSGVRCPAGGMSIADAEIQHDLRIRRSGSGNPAAATHLAMTGLKCHGAADITGLELPEDPPPAAGSPNGAVIADFATFAKKLIVAESLHASAKIPGRLDLSASTIGELAVSASSFDEEVNDKNLKVYGIVLNQAHINKFSAIQSESSYPRPIDLRFSEIKWWEFRKGDNSESDEAGDYLQLLKGDPNKQRHTFRSIEQNLFNRGHDDAADEVHKAMRKWLRGQGNGKFGRWLLNRGRTFLDFMTDSTTSPLRLVYIVVIWFAISTSLFSIPENVAPSEQGLSINRDWLADRVPPDGDWDRWAGFWMAVRFHVPVAVFTARGEWKPANGRKLKGKLKVMEWSWGWSWGWISPEDYANVVLALHWIMWPVILVIASRKVFRRLDK